MRMLRRIAGEMRFDNTVVSDLEVRTRLQQPSIDCILIRKRLRYVARIVKAMPQSLVAFLTVARADRALPWVEQMHADLAASTGLGTKLQLHYRLLVLWSFGLLGKSSISMNGSG